MDPQLSRESEPGFLKVQIGVCFFSICVVLMMAIPADGQDSYRTQQSLHPHFDPSLLQNQSTSGSNTPATAGKALRFRGWNDATTQGPTVIQHFRDLMNHKGRLQRTRAGLIPEVPRKNSLSLALPLATGSSSSTNLPGVLLRPSLPAGNLPSDIAAGDFNGDGKVDWVVANAGDNTLCMYLGKGDGTSQLPVIIPLSGQSPIGIAASDLDGDGVLDLAVVETDSATVGILHGNGDGTFAPERELTIVGTHPLGIAIGDFNGDGHPDLVVGIVGYGAPLNLDFEVLLNDGAGHFGAPIYAPKLISDGVDEGFGISIGDMNGDGIPDLLVTGADAFSTTVKSYFGNGDGSFTPGVLVWSGNPGTGSGVEAAVLADLNGDGCPDFVVAMSLGWINGFYNDCKGNFPLQQAFTYGVGDGAVGLAVADVNGDGHPDILTGGVPVDSGAFGTDAGDTMTVRLNDGTGKFMPAEVYRGDPGMVSLVVADLKHDGHPDVITVNQNANTVTVFKNDGGGGFGEPSGGYDGFLEDSPSSPANAPISPTLATDVDGDGKPDLVLLEGANDSFNNMVTLTALLNHGNGQFGLPVRTPVVPSGAVMWDFLMADFRKTGRPDFLGISILDGAHLIYAPNIGNGQFGPPVTLPTPSIDQYAFGTLGVGDFNNDGNLDIVMATPASAETSDILLIYPGNGDGTFKAPTQLSFGAGHNGQAVFVGDANGDGKKDIFVWLGGNGGIGFDLYEFLGNGDGTFQSPKPLVSNVSQLTMTDLNHDGLLDIIDIESEGSNGIPGGIAPTVYVYLGQSNGSFSQPAVYNPYPGRFVWTDISANIGDFNGDGNIDIALFQFSTPYVSPIYVQFLSGNGDGTFTPTYDLFRLGATSPPALSAFNLLGDHRSTIVQTPTFTSSFDIMPSIVAPLLQLDMIETPVLGSKDAIEVSLNVPSSTDTVVAISSSDPNIQIMPSATVPAGQLSIEVPFTLATGFPANHWFSVSGQIGSSTAIAYNFPLPSTAESPFALAVNGGFGPHSISNFSTPGPGESSTWNAYITSNGLGTSKFQLSCGGLPATATCTSFSQGTFDIQPGETYGSSFTVTTEPSIAPGQYPFTVEASDGFASVLAPAVLRIGSYSLSVSPLSIQVDPTGTAGFMLSTTDYFGYTQSISLGCSNLPSGATCASQGQFESSNLQPFLVNLNSVAQGTYDFAITGTSDGFVRSTTAELKVVGKAIASMSQSATSFSMIPIGATGTATGIVLTNTGNMPLSLASVVAVANPSAHASFAQTNNCGASVGPALSCTINVTFTPAGIGTSTGSLILTDNAADSPQTILLSGSGVDFAFQVASGLQPSATVIAGVTAQYNLLIQGNQIQGNIAMSCSGAPPQGSCNLPQSNPFISGSTALPFTVQVSTTTRGATTTPIGTGAREIYLTKLSPAFVITLISVLAFLLSRRSSWRYVLGVIVILGTLTVLESCGGGGAGTGAGGGTSGTPAGTYTITVTGQLNGGTRTINLTLIVQ